MLSLHCQNYYQMWKKKPISYMTDRIIESLFLDPESESEIKERLVSLKGRATGPDEINTMSLKLSNNSIAQPLAHICNLLSLKVYFHIYENRFPIYKPANPILFNHYRPVSLLYILSRGFWEDYVRQISKLTLQKNTKLCMINNEVKKNRST